MFLHAYRILDHILLELGKSFKYYVLFRADQPRNGIKYECSRSHWRERVSKWDGEVVCKHDNEIAGVS